MSALGGSQARGVGGALVSTVARGCTPSEHIELGDG